MRLFLILYIAGLISIVSSNLALAEDCESFKGPLAKTLQALEAVEFRDLNLESEVLFWLPRELAFEGKGAPIVTIGNSFGTLCGLSFENYSEEGLEIDLEVMGALVLIEQISAEPEAEMKLRSGFYVPEFEEVDIQEERHRVVFKIKVEDQVFRISILNSSPGKPIFLERVWDGQPLLVKNAKPYESIESLSLDMDPDALGSLRSYFNSTPQNEMTDFERFMKEDFVILQSGFDRWGYYREVTKPLENGSSIQIRYRRYDYFGDEYFNRSYWSRP